MRALEQSFSFVDAGRTFVCNVEASRPRADDAWWWFAVSTERHQRHAPFRALDGDTPDGVRDRVVAYYDDLQARRTAPYQSRWQRPAAPATSP